jgi:hypothetical protein
MRMVGLSVTELVGLVALTAAFGLITAGAFMASVIAGVFTLGGLLLLVGFSLLVIAAQREAKALANGQHTAGGQLRSAA